MSNKDQPILQYQILAAPTLSESFKHDLYALFEQYYADISFSLFCHDLAEKTHIIVLHHGSRIVGFSTILKKRMPEVGRGIFLFSGDTVLAKEFWGNKVLPRAFLKFLIMAKLKSPLEPLYWMLISKGFKTYLMVRRNCSISYPNYAEETPVHFKELMNRFYTKKFGTNYGPEMDLIRFAESHGAVKGDMAEPDAHALRDANVRYFLARNPHYRDGVELACIAAIRLRDFANAFRKQIFGTKRRHASAPQPLPIFRPTTSRMRASRPEFARKGYRAGSLDNKSSPSVG